MQAAHALDLEIRDLHAAERDGALQLGNAIQALIQADRRAHVLPQFRQIFQRRAGKRLLEHHQAELVQRAKHIHDRASCTRR